jgi:DNA-binding LytR/AlgR family response regulator
VNQPTAVIADDEPQLVAYLKKRLKECWPELEIVGEAANGEQALEMIRRLRPGYAFLDVQMPGMTGLEVAEQVADLCQVAFVTAYDQYAIDAFERSAVDYLLKPVSDERLRKTVDRLRRRAEPAPGAMGELRDLLQQLRPRPSYLHWLQVSMRDEITLLPVTDVDLFQASDKVTLVLNPRGEWVIRTALKELEPQLDPEQFWRVHRNAIVRVGAIERVSRDLHGQPVLHLAGHARRIAVSRPYAHRFKAM